MVEYRREKWGVGMLLNTARTRNLTEKQRVEAQEREERMIFSDFNAADQGRGKVFVAGFSTKEEAVKAVERHNDLLLAYLNATQDLLKDKVW